jgi:hypothetical protein
VCGRASLPVSLVSVVGSKGDEQSDAGDEDANGVGVVEIIYQNGLLDLILYLFDVGIVLCVGGGVVEHDGGATVLAEEVIVVVLGVVEETVVEG